MALRTPPKLHQHRGTKLVAAPVEEPVTITELKTHLRLSGSDEDTYLTALIIEARTTIEDRLNIAMVDQTWEMALDNWGRGDDYWWDGVRDGAMGDLFAPNANTSVGLPRWPLSSVTSVKTYDEASAETIVTIATTFDIDTYRTPGRLTLKSGSTWPVATRANNAIIIRYVAGYGDASDVPAPLKRAVRQLAAYMYEHRGDGCSAGEALNDSGMKSMLTAYEVKEV